VAASVPGPQVNYPSSPPAAGSPSAASGLTLSWPNDSEPKIFFWGPPFAGKTTFLGALFIAQHRPQDFGTWAITANDDRARQFQKDLTNSLESKRQFPKANVDIEAPMSWTFHGDLSNTSYGMRHGPADVPKILRGPRWNRRITDINFTLHLQDLPGGTFDPTNTATDRDQVVEHLAKADAILYLHDPRRDADEDDSTTVEFFHDMLDSLMFNNRNDLIKGRLHHYVAACVTKFDHPGVYRPALKETFAIVDKNRPRAPRVTRENSRAFFNWICDQHRNAGVDLVRSALADKFIGSRVSYYATSAVGFYEADHGIVDLADCSNLGTVRDENGDMVDGIRGPLHPINVLEPLVDLVIKIRQARPGTAAP